ncbi:GAF domain-containing protein [uncultured Gimesia sp.]|jgi:GAF domain-containing protein|uniref:GAF domain-containing protein n=1 Tax=uncultured Gimesia sp. TaxID=1678688 RepID=UPI00262A7140|nr:GAF domain-containing protein [uncultured Gimesia sp.]
MQQQTNEILILMEEALGNKKTVAPVLDQILEFLGGRAIGLWRCGKGKLLQIGFRAVPEMDEQISRQFAEFTQEVPLENTGLGIVKAVLDQIPAIGTLQGENSGLQGSSEWLRKFEAQQSYAVPIFDADQVVGVLAISTNCIHHTGDTEWKILTNIAAGIGEKKLLGML